MKPAFIILIIIAASLTAQPSRAQQTSTPQHQQTITPQRKTKRTTVKHKSASAVQPVAAPTPPAPPPTLEQEPAIQPQVAFANGQLTITAQNSTLGEILRAVRNRTGASVDVPANATERVVGRFGPGPARDVLASLLNGTHFNYVLLGSAADPNALERVVLISKSGGTENTQVNQASAAQPNVSQPPAPMPAGEVATEPTMTDDEDPAQDQQPAQDVDQSNQEEAPQQPNPLSPPPGVRTPEQLLQELQRQQQQQQQQSAPQGFPTPQN